MDPICPELLNLIDPQLLIPGLSVYEESLFLMLRKCNLGTTLYEVLAFKN